MPHMYSIFFYGTLMHAPVLCRVLGSDGAHLSTSEAVLLGHTRHHVRGEDYPAVVALGTGEALVGRALSGDEGSVRGTLVTGLTDRDVELLDEFEGSVSLRAPHNSPATPPANLLPPAPAACD